MSGCGNQNNTELSSDTNGNVEQGYICGWPGDTGICFRSTDKGNTWSSIEINLPDEVEFDEWAAEVPLFDEANGIMPIILRFGDGRAFETVYLATADDGETWIFYK